MPVAARRGFVDGIKITISPGVVGEQFPYPVVKRAPEAGSFHFARLEHVIGVREDDGNPPLLHVLHRVQRARIQTVGEWVIDQPTRHAQHIRTMHLLDPEALQRTKP